MNSDDRNGAAPTLEEELAAAMAEFAGGERTPVFDPGAITRSAGVRRRRITLGLAAVGAAAATVAAVLVSSGGGQDRRPAPPATPPSTTAPATTAALDADDVTRKLFIAAELYQQPGTRHLVHTARIAALFTDAAAFHRVWGTDARPLTCGQHVDGVLVGGVGDVQFYRGGTHLGRDAGLTFDGATGRVTDVVCDGGDGTPGDQVVADRYGRKDGVSHGRTDCGRPAPTVWFADGPASGTVVRGWTVRLDGGVPFTISIDQNDTVTPANCTP